MADQYDFEKADKAVLRDAKVRVYEAALDTIAHAPCDHGPGICPRQIARIALGWHGIGAVLNEQVAHRAEVKP